MEFPAQCHGWIGLEGGELGEKDGLAAGFGLQA